MILLLVIWFLLGIHSVWFFIKRYTQKNDLTTNEIWMIAIAFLLPIATHIATLVCYPNLKPKTIKPRIMADCKKCKGEVQNDSLL
jgi:hypothetical protein